MFHIERSQRLSYLAMLMVWASPLAAATFYVNQVRGSDANDGSQTKPFETVARALKETDGIGGEIDLSPEGGPYRDSIIIRKGGKSGNPLILDGHGSIVNLGIDVTQGPWTPSGNGFVLDRPVVMNSRFWLVTVAFVNGLPLFCSADNDHRHHKAWHGGSACYNNQGRLMLIFPKGLSPSNSVVVLTGGKDGAFSSGVQILGASYVRIRNLTTAFASNDGFNFHVGGHDILLENVKGIFNGDQGTSSHESCEVEVRNSEFAFNGSGDGAVEDIQDAITTYRNVRVHQNRGYGVLFINQGPSARHLLDNVVSFGNGLDNLPKATPTVELNHCQDLGQIGGDHQIPVVTNPNVRRDSTKPVNETDLLGRFLQVRPPAP